MRPEGDRLYDTGGLLIARSAIAWQGVSIELASVERAEVGRAPRGPQSADVMFILGALCGLVVMVAIEGRLEKMFLAVGWPLLAFVVFLFSGEGTGLHIKMRSGDRLVLELKGFSRSQLSEVEAASQTAFTGTASRAG